MLIMSEMDIIAEEVSLIELTDEEDTIMDIQSDEVMPNMNEDNSISMPSSSSSLKKVKKRDG